MFALILRRYLNLAKDQVWSKVLLFCLTLFLIRLADALISYWAPNQIQSVLNNSVVMGLTISFQSVVGFLADIVFPDVLRMAKVRRLVFLGIIMSALTSLFLVSSTFMPWVLILLVTMALWGIYYELVAFASYQFMGSVVPKPMRAGAWAVVGIFINLAYFIGPLAGAFLLLKGAIVTEAVIIGLLLLSTIILLFNGKSHDAPTQIDLSEVNPFEELKHWLTLSKYIWPAIIISLLLGFIDSTFWTTGAVWTDKLAKVNILGGLFLPLYQLPSIFLGLLIAKWGIEKGKKILSEKVLIVAGIFLIGLAASQAIVWQLAMVLLSASALSICYPLLDGVYSDLIARMGKEKKVMIGLISSVVNISYVVWPPIAGFITSRVGERLTFSVVGVMTVIVAVVLLFITPKKLRLPESQIVEWK